MKTHLACSGGVWRRVTSSIAGIGAGVSDAVEAITELASATLVGAVSTEVGVGEGLGKQQHVHRQA